MSTKEMPPNAWREAGKLDVEGEWQNVKDEYIDQFCSILSHASDEGYRYYLPAYMCWSLRNVGDTLSMSVDWPIYSLSPPKEPGLMDWHRRRFSIFNTAQRTAIIDYLEYMGQDDRDCDWSVAQTALDFWKTFHEQASAIDNQRPKRVRSSRKERLRMK